MVDSGVHVAGVQAVIRGRATQSIGPVNSYVFKTYGFFPSSDLPSS